MLKTKMWERSKIWKVIELIGELIPKDRFLVSGLSLDQFLNGPSYVIEKGFTYFKTIEGNEFKFTTKLFCNAKSNKVKFASQYRSRSRYWGGSTFTNDPNDLVVNLIKRIQDAEAKFVEKNKQKAKAEKMLEWLRPVFPENASIVNDYGFSFSVSNLVDNLRFRIFLEEEGDFWKVGEFRMEGDEVHPLMFKALLQTFEFKPEFNNRVAGRRRIILETLEKEKRVAKYEEMFLI